MSCLLAVRQYAWQPLHRSDRGCSYSICLRPTLPVWESVPLSLRQGESAAQWKHDGEPGFRHAAKAGNTAAVETSWDNRAHRWGGAATATRDPLQENCPV